VNLLIDDKQAILSRNPERSDGQYLLEKIMFIKVLDSWKLLSINTQGFIDEGEDNFLVDSDKDGLLDVEENCTADNNPWCEETDPANRDTNNNGWWDSVDIAMEE